MSDPAPPADGPERDAVALALLDHLQPTIIDVWSSMCELAPKAAATSIVVAGTRPGVVRVAPWHRGTARHAVLVCPRVEVLAWLAAQGEAEAVLMVPTEGSADRIDVVLVTAEVVGFIELHATGATAKGGRA